MCKPYRSPLQAVFILVFTAVFVLISAYLTRCFPDIAFYLRLAGGVFLLLGAYLLFRYTMVEFVYVLNGNILSVRRKAGFTEREVFSVALTASTKLYTKAEFEKNGRHGVCYRQNLTASSAFVLYDLNGKERYVEIEPNIEFYALLQKAIDNQKEA